MSLHRVVLIMAAIAGLGAGAFGATTAQAEASMDIRMARPLTSGELYQLYNSPSWLLEAGAGHFAVRAPVLRMSGLSAFNECEVHLGPNWLGPLKGA